MLEIEISVVATALTVYGIETKYNHVHKDIIWCVETVLIVYGIETGNSHPWSSSLTVLQQHLLFTVCTEGCETAEEQGDDEVRTSQVPERR